MEQTDSGPVQNSKLLPIDEALCRIQQQIVPISGMENLTLKDCLGRVLAHNLESPIDVPGNRTSSMDGYAFSSSDLPKSGSTSLRIEGTAWAGRPFAGKLANQHCIRIMTGAVIPDTADSVVIQENVQRNENRIEISSQTLTHKNIREPGDDIKAGEPVLPRGKRLTPTDLAILASLGIGETSVLRKPRIAFFSTGDELRTLGDTLAEGEIYDSNRYTLYGVLQALDVEILDLGHIGDDKKKLVEVLLEAAQINDAIITSGGVSVGDADLVKNILDEVGQVNFWKIAMKPGKPFAYGRIGNAHFFGLPGNPVSVLVTYYQIVRPSLLQLMGTTPRKPLRLTARCTSSLSKIPGRQEFMRGFLSQDDQGNLIVTPAQKQQSNAMSGMSHCNCFIVLSSDSPGLNAGDSAQVEPLDPPFTFD